MKNNNLIRFVQALAFLPIMTMSFSFPGIYNGETSQNVLVKKVNIEIERTSGILAFNQVIDPKINSISEKEQTLKAQANAIDAYFKARNMPLVGTGMTMVLEAEKNGIDWRLLPAIAVRESTGGKNACEKVKYNSFGWGSCKIGFKSNEQAIEVVAKNLGGNNPNTARHYDEKTTKQILRAYNPPSIVPKYAEQVISIMNAIGEVNITLNILEPSSDLLVQKV